MASDLGLSSFYFVKIDFEKLDDKKIIKLINNRWASSDSLWAEISKIKEANKNIYSNKAEWLKNKPAKKDPIQSNRIFVNTESVINSLIANPAKINMLPTRNDEVSRDFAIKQEQFFQKKFEDINWKETMRMALRNLYFSRLLAIKAFWNHDTNDFDFKALDPCSVRFGVYAKNEDESEFVIEEVEDSALGLLSRFPDKKKELLKEFGTSEEELYIENKQIKYKETWISDRLICTYGNIVLSNVLNPYYDFDGVLTENYDSIVNNFGKEKRTALSEEKTKQGDYQARKLLGEDLRAYYFNYFDKPRKPYIFATIFNSENKPIGDTDMITMASTLQMSIDKRKQDIDENCDLVNGIIKVDKDVMSKAEAQALLYETKGVIYGKGVVAGVARETGGSLPQMVFDDMQDSRNEIDNIMAATSAFRGEREGQETKAGRLALIDQSALRLNELVQVIDYVSSEAFKWAYQLAKTRYLEEHYAKWLGPQSAQEVIAFTQDDFMDGLDIEVIPGKTLPQDAQFRFERAQADVQAGIISPVDYLVEAGYNNPKQLAQNAVLYQQNPAEAVGLTPQEVPQPFAPGQIDEPPIQPIE